MGSYNVDTEGLTQLETGQHISDEIINDTFQLLLTSSNKKDEVVDYVSPHVFDHFVKHKEGEQGMLFVDERKLFLRTTNFAVILFPLCFDKHWILVIYHKPMKSIVYFDSGRIIFRDQKIMDKITQYLAYLLPETSNSTKYIQRGWLQRDDSSCGIYILYYAFCFLRCVTMHQTDFLTLDMKSRQQLKSALEKKKLTGIARLVYPKCQSGGATAHKSVKQFMAVNCILLEDYMKSPSSYDSNPESELIKGMGETSNYQPALDVSEPHSPQYHETAARTPTSASGRQSSTPQPQQSPQHTQPQTQIHPEKEKLVFKIRKERTNSDGTPSGLFTTHQQNNLNGEGSRPPIISTRPLAGVIPPSDSIHPRRITIAPIQSSTSRREVFNVPTRSPPELIDPGNFLNHQQRRGNASEQPSCNLLNNHLSNHNLNNLSTHRDSTYCTDPTNQFNNHQNNLNQPQSLGKRKEISQEPEPKPKKFGANRLPSQENTIYNKKINDLLEFFRDNYSEDRPFCPIINSEVTIKIEANPHSNISVKEEREDKGIQCEVIPTALFTKMTWRMVNGEWEVSFKA